MDQKNSDNTTKKKNKKKNKRSFGKTILIGFLITLLILTGAGAGVAVAVIKSAPNIDTDILNNLKQSSMMFDKDQKPIERVSGEINRTVVPLNEIPDNLQKAFISIEDERFYKHSGIDIKRIFGAVFHNVRTMSKSQGASTLTQQLIKNYALTPEKKFTRKLQEMYLSLQLEKKLSKEQILEAYLNTIFLGGYNTYGVESASQHYFGKDVEKLTLAESALIAGITQNPSKYYPYSKRNEKDPSAYIQRQHTVLYKMLENGYITKEQYESAKADKLKFVDKKPTYTGKYQWFVEPALDEIAKDFAAKYNINEKDARNQIATGGYSIYLTVDPTLQEAAQRVANNPKYYSGLYVPSKYKEYSPSEKTEKKIQPQVAAAIYDYNTGDMVAIVGGRGEHEIGSLNRATDVPRQPGSSIKPLSVYGPALDRNLVTPASTVSGSRLSPSETGGWNPKNANGQYPDRITVRDALRVSMNTVAVRLGIKVGKSNSMDYLKNKFHLSTVTENDKSLAALSLGGMTHGTLATEMAAAYGVFGNNGMYKEPRMYTKVLDRNGNLVLEKKSTENRSLSSTASYLTLDMMKGVVSNGTGKSAAFGGMPTAGKTGTTNESATVWFTGLTPYYSGAVWVGHDKPSIAVNGLKSNVPARIWADIMREAHRGLSYKDFKRPAGFVSVEVCPVSGKLVTEFCRQAGITPTSDYFPAGSQPSEVCDVHTGIPKTEEVTPETPSTTTPPATTPSTEEGNFDNGNTNSGNTDGNTGNTDGNTNGNTDGTPNNGNGTDGNNGTNNGGNIGGNTGGNSGGTGGNTDAGGKPKPPTTTTPPSPTALVKTFTNILGLILWK
ncbi:transglycosylase domain-containing protein [Clostridium cylindrosporum]|uniref:Penicillin-binding protein 1A n=1 Tax=Clostridium cylindrosporum DSM 605 TaxID=1121307 RepID=A0A0J8D9Q0_CLOCY|nr:PBP1A family penicillin-binding protein [Clostridium cylindrosporum]KMT22572.1 penicillin-binding protein 1A [Clostridium cylindrosporum DSM 605]